MASCSEKGLKARVLWLLRQESRASGNVGSTAAQTFVEIVSFAVSLRVGEPGKAISIRMSAANRVSYDEIVLLESERPSCKSTILVTEANEPAQCVVIGYDSKGAAVYVGTKFGYRENQSQTFLLGHCVRLALTATSPMSYTLSRVPFVENNVSAKRKHPFVSSSIITALAQKVVLIHICQNMRELSVTHFNI